MGVYAWEVADDPASLASLHRQARHISYLMPVWYTIDATLAIRSVARASVLAFARERGLGVLPLIKFRHVNDPRIVESVLHTREARARVADKIAGLVLEHGYDGINLDFEGRFGAYRDGYSDLVARIAALLHPAGKRLSVDVVPQLTPVAAYAAASFPGADYDYGALAQVCDAVILMAYAYSVAKPGPLAPLWWVREALVHALTEIPARKLVLGTSFYGRHWITHGGQVTHSDLTQAQAEALLAQSGATLERPGRDATPRFAWRDRRGDHVVHYDDGLSLAAKLDLAVAAGVAGVAFWRLGQEDATQWEVIGRAVGQR
jgi:spore germination protein YaaH